MLHRLYLEGEDECSGMDTKLHAEVFQSQVVDGNLRGFDVQGLSDFLSREVISD